MKDSLLKRIEVLNQLIEHKKQIVTFELGNIETLCVELLGLHDRLMKLENEQDNGQ